MISSKFQVEADVEVLITCAMAHISFGIYIIDKSDTLWNISMLQFLMHQQKQIGQSAYRKFHSTQPVCKNLRLIIVSF